VLYGLVGKQTHNGHGDWRRTTAGAGRGGRALSAWTILHSIENIKQTHFHLLSINGFGFPKCGQLVDDLKIDLGPMSSLSAAVAI
jgi:hypothetical protein